MRKITPLLVKEEQLSELPQGLQSLLSDERAAPGMPLGMQERISERLALSIDAMAPPDLGAETSPSGASSDVSSIGDGLEDCVQVVSGTAEAAATSASLLARFVAKPAVIALLSATVGAGAGVVGTQQYYQGHSSRVQRPALVRPLAPDAATLVSDAATLVSDASTTPTKVEKIPEAKEIFHRGVKEGKQKQTEVETKEPPTKDKNDEGLAMERKLIEFSRTAISRGNALVAVEKLRQHQQQFAHGKLSEERDALWVKTLFLMESWDLAKQKARMFRKKYPQSIFRSALEKTLSEIPGEDSE